MDGCLARADRPSRRGGQKRLRGSEKLNYQGRLQSFGRRNYLKEIFDSIGRPCAGAERTSVLELADPGPGFIASFGRFRH
jgi:hypothetical protein